MAGIYRQMPACALHADRNIISFIKDHKVIDRIIDHLKLTFKAERPPPPQAQLSIAAEESMEYL
ncbi:MAG: acid--CoA ligase [Candidatus Aminicenantaceae bacterium]